METKIYRLYGVDTAMHLLRPGAKWEAPTPMPDDGKMYSWDEATTSWIEV